MAAGALVAPALLEASGLLWSAWRMSARRPAGGLARHLLPAARGLARVYPEDLRSKVDAAHLPLGLDSAAMMGIKVSLAAATGALLFVAASFSVLPAAPLFLLLMPAAAFVAPDTLLARRARRVRSEVLAELPELADRLHLAVCAGLPPLRAAAAAARKGAGPLSRELVAATVAAQAGVPFAAALDRMTRRCPAPEVRSIAAALIRSQQQGSDISSLLIDVSRSARRESSRRLRDRAQKAAPKIQLAVALLLVPAAMALIAAALLSGLFSG